MSARVPIAIVGAGPAGAFTAAELIARFGDRFAIDLIDRLPTPWGLLRAGVAPDHDEIKRLDEHFERETFARGCRFFGNVDVGVDVSHAELAERYAAIVYATGAQTDNSLGIPGEELAGSIPATALVGWYNGHPDYADLAPDLSVSTAIVIGNGNVAADVTRLLTRSVDELALTDISDPALAALRQSSVERVIVLGRRGPAQVAFTSTELRELGRLAGVDVIVDPRDAELDPVSQEWLEQDGTFTARRNIELLREYATNTPTPGNRRIELRFLSSPVALHGEDRVTAIEITRNEIVRDDAGLIRARSIAGETETIECGLVLRSVGYRSVPLPDVPFDERRYVLPNERGRVVDAQTREPRPGIYTVGWIKRGPTGILGTNKRDALETAGCLAEDLEAGLLSTPAGASDLADLLDGRAEVVTRAGWTAIDAHERSAGEADDRPRRKLVTREELVQAAS